MTSRTTKAFRNLYSELPPEIRRAARKAYELFRQNPEHPGLRLKKVHAKEPIYSVRITRDFRAVGIRESRQMIWFWIGSHDEYEELLTRI